MRGPTHLCWTVIHILARFYAMFLYVTALLAYASTHYGDTQRSASGATRRVC
jgi:hypothetical protein